jgi:hypothetical protein
MTWRQLAVKLMAATGLTYDEMTALSWQEIEVKAEANRWREYGSWSRARWIAAVVATIQSGKRVTPASLLPLEFDNEGRDDSSEWQPDPDRIAQVARAWRIKPKSNGKG